MMPGSGGDRDKGQRTEHPKSRRAGLTYAVTASITLDDVSRIFLIKWPALPLRKPSTPLGDRSGISAESLEETDPLVGEGGQ